ncbi:MAG: hypothetical protein DMG65_01530 [Candidatus Angelobacter sp. Gp1-AA117]|nr:MAG: hypothetical protein DMG65_01530 [Candidatus Angelobacter sp. Gp1-AA117]
MLPATAVRCLRWRNDAPGSGGPLMGTGIGQLVPLVLYAGVICTCVLSVFWKPQAGVYVLIPLLPYEALREKLVDYPAGSHVIYLLLISVLVGVALKGQLPIPRTPVNRALLAFAAFLYVSLWQGALYLRSDFPLLPTDPRFSVWKDYMAMPLLFVVTMAAIRTRRQVQLVLLLVCFSILVVDRSALMNVLSHNFSHFDEGKRDGGPLGYAGSNGLAAFEAQCSCFLLGFAAYEKRRLRKFALYGLVAITLYCLLYSFSRGGYVALLAGLLVIGILKNRKMVLVVAGLLLTWQLIVPVAVQERINMTVDEDQHLEESANQRVQLWTDAQELVRSNPALGTGYATYMYMGRVEGLKDTHNIYVKVLVETGVIGMVVFLWLLARLFSTAWRLFRQSGDAFSNGLALGLLSLLGCLLVANLFGDRWTYIEVNGLVWVLFAIAAQTFIFNSAAQPEPVVLADVDADVKPLTASVGLWERARS